MIGYVLWLAILDLWHDRRMSLCHVLGMTAVLAPLLILFGLKNGFITGISDRMMQSADKRMVLVTLKQRHPLSEMERLKEKVRSITFMVPATRSMAATLSGVEHKGSDVDKVADLVNLMPTRRGDPLRPPQSRDTELGPGEVVLSNDLAQELKAGVGASLSVRVARRNDDSSARLLKFTVKEILGKDDTAGLPRGLMLVPLVFAERLENFLDGNQVEDFWKIPNPGAGTEFAYLGLRLHADRLEEIPALHAAMRERGHEVFSQEADIRALLDLDRGLGIAFWAIAAIGAIGYVLALAATMFANVERKRHDLAVMSLIGIRTRRLMLFPVAQALILTLAGSLLSLGAYLVVGLMLDLVFTMKGNGQAIVVSRLGFGHGLGAVLISCAAAALAAAFSSLAVAKIDPAEVLREH